MDPFTIALIAAGTATIGQSIGNLIANHDQAQAEAANAKFFREQAKFAQEAADRSEDIFKRDAEHVKAAQLGAFAKAGVEISGSPLLTMQATNQKVYSGVQAIRREGEMNVKLAELRGQSSQNTADKLGSFSYNALQTAGTLLTGGSQIYGMATNRKAGGVG